MKNVANPKQKNQQDSMDALLNFGVCHNNQDMLTGVMTTAVDTSYGGYDYNTSISIRNGLPSILDHSLTLSNSGIFFISFIVLLCVMGYFIKRTASMKWNQKLLFILVSTFIVIQMLCLISRTIYNAIGINMKLIPLTEVIPDLKDKFITFHVFSLFENFCAKIQLITVFVIQAFIIHLFLRTILLVDAMSKKTYRILNIVTMVMTVLFGLALLVLLLVVVFTQLLNKLSIIKLNQTYIYIVTFVIYIPIAVYQTIVMLGAAIRVLFIIKQRSLNKSQVKDQSMLAKAVQRPFNKIVALVLVVTFTSLLQIVSMAVGIIVSTLNPDAHVAEHFLQCLGVFVVAVVVLLLYNPLLNDAYETESKPIEKTRSVVNPKVHELKSIKEDESPTSLSPTPTTIEDTTSV